MPIPAELIDIVACPRCKGKVKLTAESKGFACSACKLLYPIVDDIPNFLIEDAKPLDAP